MNVESADRLEFRIASHYSDLPEKLQNAANYITEHPERVAMNSMRTIAHEAGLTPSTFTRLARAIGYDSFDELRESCQQRFASLPLTLSERVTKMQSENQNGEDETAFFHKQAKACLHNIETMLFQFDPKDIDYAVEKLDRANRVIIVGALSSSGLADYFGYIGSWVKANWQVIYAGSTSLNATLNDLAPTDVIFVITKAPFAARSLTVAKLAHELGLEVIVLSDSLASPALKYASVSFVVPAESPQFFSSYAATVVLLETIIGSLATRGGEAVSARIAKVEKLTRESGEYQSRNL